MSLILRQYLDRPLTIQEMDANFVYATAGGYTETIVNISSAQILSMGTTPIELLPAPGENKYYEGYIIVEWNHGTVNYDFFSTFLVCYGGMTAYTFIDVTQLLNNQDLVFKSTNGNQFDGSSYGTLLNYGVYMTTDDANDPTDGNGIGRVKIYHKTITFGA